MQIRNANIVNDYEAIWEIFEAIIKTGETYVFDPKTSKESLNQHWFASYMKTFVATIDNKIVGTYIIKPNQIDLGNHIANCSYMVHPQFSNQGIGNALCKHSFEIAKENGFLGIQFNIVVSTNLAAVQLWQKNGFSIIGTTPNGFRHARLGFVDTYIMFKSLENLQ